MNRDKLNLRFGLVALMILMAALSRLLPHPPNFTPIGGMALFGAAYFTKKYWAFLIPILSLWLSNLIIDNVVYAHFYDSFVWFNAYTTWVYVAFILIALMGMATLKQVNPRRLLGVSVLASVLFFLVTNFGHWLADPMAPKNFGGLIAAYIAGIPFFWNTLIGDLFYVVVLFEGFELVSRRYPQLAFQQHG